MAVTMVRTTLRTPHRMLITAPPTTPTIIRTTIVRITALALASRLGSDRDHWREPTGAKRNLVGRESWGARRTGENYDHLHPFLDSVCGAWRPCRRSRDRGYKGISK